MTAASVDLLNLRWRAARWLLSISEGDIAGAAAVVATADVEGWALVDFADEADLLAHQFRTPAALTAEMNRLWGKLNGGVS